jgi:hypothetical protein
MTPRRYFVHGFEGRGGRYIVADTSSAREARDIRDVRLASGFKTVVFDSDRELTLEELDQFADLEDRFGPKDF